ncbi:polysaccharide deacetylase family protein [Flavihumibacter sp. ZG627]|uniref:polysaccharide deacetylase family protein n=1 Tax=Flavihumibacter sp. ZG627 TaxID=1463156 RepID=UPI00069489DD|nr:polysaccharide deacetylase family protein [Flavihumibacter sp. ZG627]
MKIQFLLPLRPAFIAGFSLLLLNCSNNKPEGAGKIAIQNAEASQGISPTPANKEASVSLSSLKVPDAVTVLSMPQIPVLCYHQVRDYRASDSRSARDYIVPPAVFKEQMKILADSGYTTILPEQHYRYLVNGETLPAKPVMISFDDGCDEQFQVSEEILKPLNQKAVFFIMTVAINRPNFMSEEQIRKLSDDGHAIALHTWDHNNVKKYSGEDWDKQVAKPRKRLESITGKPVEFFAYPFGLWSPEIIQPLKEKGIVASYQLSTARDSTDPIHTIRRIIVPGNWDGPQLLKRMAGSFTGK